MAQPDLFTPAGASEIAVARAGAPVLAPGATRQRLVSLNLNALETALAPRGIDAAKDRVEKAASRQPAVRLQLFPDAGAVFQRTNIEAAYGGGYTWTGTQDGNEGTATLVISRDQVTGHVQLGERIYRIEPVSGTLHRILEIDPGRLPPDGPHLTPPKRSSGAEPDGAEAATPEPSATATAVVDVLVAYTTRARNASPNILANINLAVALANGAHTSDGTFIQLRLRGTMPVSGYDEAPLAYEATLYNLSNLTGGGSTAAGRAAFDPVRTRRNTLGADLVALIREGGSVCGQAWLIERPTAAAAPFGFSEISRGGCISNHSFAHELGHNMGLRHDRFVDPSPNTRYNYGFVNVSKRVRDIMAYQNRCTAAGVSCTRVNLFSNPRILVSGDRFGIPAGQPGAADGARALFENRFGVASFRAATAAPTAQADEDQERHDAEEALGGTPVASR